MFVTPWLHTYPHARTAPLSSSKRWRGMKPRSSIFYTAGANVIHLWARLQEHRVLALTTRASSRQRQMRRTGGGVGGTAAWGAECKIRKYLWVLHWKLSGHEVHPQGNEWNANARPLQLLLENFCSRYSEVFCLCSAFLIRWSSCRTHKSHT